MSTNLFLILTTLLRLATSQQPYVDNQQLDCYRNKTFTQGYLCNSLSTSSCLSYATFRTTSLYNSPSSVGYLLYSDPNAISVINRLPSNSLSLANDTLLIVPLSQCSCTSLLSSYQHNATYTLKSVGETYFLIANDTFEGLTTCQGLISQNAKNYLNLTVGDRIIVPIRCACPSNQQMDLGIRYLLSYLVTWGDTLYSISKMFGVDKQTILVANQLTDDDIIYPFTPILIPLKSEPSLHNAVANGNGNGNDSSRKWVIIGIGIVVSLLVLSGL